jgi:DNA processing protein
MFFDKSNNLTEIPYSSPDYPTAWKELSDAPEKLYALGNTSLLRERKFAIVGSRRTPTNALKLGEEIAKTLSSSFVILTGTADGGDTAAIEGALKGSGRVICLLAGGFSALPQYNLALLERVAKRGLILSPHPYDTEVRAFSYEYRNKLLAKLCEGVLVLGAGEKSGALITAKYAKEYEKKIFAFPYPPNAAAGVGCNRLIKQGGYLTEEAEDIARVLGLDLSKAEKAVALTADEEKIYGVLQELSEGHIAEISEKAGIPSFKARALLSSLEIKGVAVAVGGNRYSVV